MLIHVSKWTLTSTKRNKSRAVRIVVGMYLILWCTDLTIMHTAGHLNIDEYLLFKTKIRNFCAADIFSFLRWNVKRF